MPTIAAALNDIWLTRKVSYADFRIGKAVSESRIAMREVATDPEIQAETRAHIENSCCCIAVARNMILWIIA
jgi:hypothetical protein